MPIPDTKTYLPCAEKDQSSFIEAAIAFILGSLYGIKQLLNLILDLSF